MRMLRIGMVWLVVLGVSASAVAGDLKKSIAKAAEQQAAQVENPPAPTKAYAIAGGALVIGGVIAVAYGFLHTKSFEEWQPAHIAVGSVGLGAVIAGGLVLLNGQDQATRSPSLAFGKHGVKVSKHLSW